MNNCYISLQRNILINYEPFQQIFFFLFLYFIIILRLSRRYTLCLHTLFLAAQKGWPPRTPRTKNKLHPDVSSRGYVSLPLSTLSSSHHQQTSPPPLLLQGLTLKNSPLPRFYLATTAWRGIVEMGRTHCSVSLWNETDAGCGTFLLSLPLSRVGRSMSRLDMWRMKGAEQPTCTRETIFFLFSLSLSSFFFFFAFPSPPSLPPSFPPLF